MYMCMYMAGMYTYVFIMRNKTEHHSFPNEPNMLSSTLLRLANI